MAIITIASSKGGAGKTTIARLLLGHAVQYGSAAAGLDADLNHTLSDWITEIAKYPITARMEVNEARIVPVVSELHEKHDLVVVDTAGAPTQATIFAIGCADLVLVPCKLSSADITEAIKTMQLVASAGMMMGNTIPARVVLTGFKPRTQIAAHVESELEKAKLTAMRTRLHDLVAFEEMSFSGIVPALGAAGMQTSGLYDEAIEIIAAADKTEPRKRA